jgi:hypothetical protein
MIRRLLMAFCGIALFSSGAFASGQSDIDMAERYSKAARAGDDSAQFYLGALYSSGTGVSQSDRDAYLWISRAAEQGHSQAMLVLAGLLTLGRGTPKDELAAYKWAHIVAEGSRVEEYKNGARQLRSLLETRMTPANVSQAKSDAERFRASTQSPATPSPASTSSGNSTPPSPSAPARASEPTPTPGSPLPSTASRDTPASKSDRNSEMDKMLDMVPPGMRKRYGF